MSELYTSFEMFKYLVWAGFAVALGIQTFNDFQEDASGKFFVTAWETDMTIWGWLIGTAVVYSAANYFFKEMGLWVIGLAGWLIVFSGPINWLRATLKR